MSAIGIGTIAYHGKKERFVKKALCRLMVFWLLAILTATGCGGEIDFDDWGGQISRSSPPSSYYLSDSICGKVSSG